MAYTHLIHRYIVTYYTNYTAAAEVQNKDLPCAIWLHIYSNVFWDIVCLLSKLVPSGTCFCKNWCRSPRVIYSVTTDGESVDDSPDIIPNTYKYKYII